MSENSSRPKSPRSICSLQRATAVAGGAACQLQGLVDDDVERRRYQGTWIAADLRRHTKLAEGRQLVEQQHRMGDEETAEMCGRPGKAAGADMMKDMAGARGTNHGVAGLGAAIAANHHGPLRGRGKAIDHQSFAFIAIKRADHGLCLGTHHAAPQDGAQSHRPRALEGLA